MKQIVTSTRNLRVLVAAALSLVCLAPASAQWRPAGNRIRTVWADKVSPQNTSKEYPRPVMQRDQWKSLDGMWQYAIRKRGTAAMGQPDGEILVPFAVESSLSGVQRTVGKDSVLWYRRSVTVPKQWGGKRVMLNFGAVDWQADVYVNGVKVGRHRGGYSAFGFDITPYLNHGGQQRIELCVWDPTDQGYQPSGKQHVRPDGIWYTPVTGIWQTVWMEPVESNHVTAVNTVSDIDNSTLSVTAKTSRPEGIVEVELLDGGRTVATGRAAAGQTVDLSVPDAKLWSPDSPHLYDMKIRLTSNGRTLDQLTSYAAMRKVSVRRDAHGIMRLQLNNRDLFQFGPLDQGYWPDGLYTAPTDEALRYDIEQTKRMGYNMIRKHMKVEPARWYTWCDRLGILVWQDMPAGGDSPEWQNHDYFKGSEVRHTAEADANFMAEWKEVIDNLQPYPCIVTWTPFNECWGQHDTREIAEWTKAYDPTRLVNPASGGNFYHDTGDMLDLHSYPAPDLFLYDASRPTVLGEFGGLGLPLEGHTWQTDRNWGYVQFRNADEELARYNEYAAQLATLIKSGFSAAVYTQTTDVEGEINGLMTYDRKVTKMNADSLYKTNNAICHSLDGNK